MTRVEDNTAADVVLYSPTKVRTVGEDTSWRSRQRLLASKGKFSNTAAASSASSSPRAVSRSFPARANGPTATPAASFGGVASYHQRHRVSGEKEEVESSEGGSFEGGCGRDRGLAPLFSFTQEASPRVTKWSPFSPPSVPTAATPRESNGGNEFFQARGAFTRDESRTPAPIVTNMDHPHRHHHRQPQARQGSPRASLHNAGAPKRDGENPNGDGGASYESKETNGVHSPSKEWNRRTEGGDVVDMEYGGESRGGDGFAEDLDKFASALREAFDHKIVGLAKEKMRQVSQAEAKAGRVQLEALKRESARERRIFEGEGARLRERVAILESANKAVADKADTLGERLSALQARTSRGSVVARCLCVWRENVRRVRTERSKNKTAVEHASRTLTLRILSAWRLDTRKCVNSRGRKAADRKLHAISKEIIERYEAELATTRAALDAANVQIALEKARQRETEEGMRRTLLRGMSAMNMEAMRVITGAREAGEETASLGLSGASDATRYLGVRTAPSSVQSRPATGAFQRTSEECPLPMAPPKPTVPSSRQARS